MSFEISGNEVVLTCKALLRQEFSGALKHRIFTGFAVSLAV